MESEAFLSAPFKIGRRFDRHFAQEAAGVSDKHLEGCSVLVIWELL